MKYKRLLTAVTILLFIVVAVISFSYLFKINDIKLSVTHIENSSEDIDGKITEYSKSLEGKNILFLNEKSIKEDLLKMSPYIEVVSIMKNYPSQIKITVREMKESFSIKIEDKYYVVDNHLRILAIKDKNENNVDGLKNIELIVNGSDIDLSNLKEGKTIKFIDEETSKYLLSNSNTIIENVVINNIENFSLMREDVASIKINVLTNGNVNRKIILTTNEGMIVNFDNADIRLNDKIEFFNSWYKDINTIKSGEYTITIDNNSNEIAVRT